ncbi:GlxA family transcriptional regulator [Rhodococcus chondri]|uniref:GlxA family transcriptional regulator n=1 Tax=Rhodococcus chondri TaxID=3065941 RepID=A0ABU7JPK8_9NOCA|nr:GlxA family transcriptional regulator [Rhodococcus sp. CC-R104]MEE2031965.1 GlxA family transcriptional regulator [Rhodococcus sp. CC-R104]
MTDLRRVVVVGYPAAELLDIACVTTTLEMANWLHGSAVYRVSLASPGGAPIHTACGLSLDSKATLERLTGPLDTLLVSGGPGYVDAMNDPGLVAHVRRLARESRRIASVCTGAGILAATGLLNGRRAATHWEQSAALAARYPAVEFDGDPIYVADGNVFTSAGVTAALDLTLAFIETDVGADLARAVSRHPVTYLQRPGNQAQMSMFTAAPPPTHSLVRRTVEYITGHPDADLSTAVLAVRAGVSERHLTRLFSAQVGVTPGRFVRRARTEAAPQLLTSTVLPVEAVAARCGFGSAETLRQAFQSRFGVTPSHYGVTQGSTAGSRR